MAWITKRPAVGVWLVPLVLSGCASGVATAVPPTVESMAPAENAVVTPTTTCTGTPTLAQTEGPYYKAGAPEVLTLVDETTSGDRLMLTGHVLTTDCTPLAGAALDIWQADASGAYDNAGYRMRGRVTTDADGAYALETVIPGPYPGRTPHIHVKVFDPGGRELLTTQIYLRGVSERIADSIFDPRLLARDLPADEDGRRVVAFDIVVQP